MRFAPGQPVLRRYYRGGRIGFLNVCRVLADDERGLRMWLPIGAPYWRSLTPDPFDGTWCDLAVPGPAWPPLVRPPAWARPRALA